MLIYRVHLTLTCLTLSYFTALTCQEHAQLQQRVPHYILKDEEASKAHHGYAAQRFLQAWCERAKAAVLWALTRNQPGHESANGGQGYHCTKA